MRSPSAGFWYVLIKWQTLIDGESTGSGNHPLSSRVTLIAISGKGRQVGEVTAIKKRSLPCPANPLYLIGIKDKSQILPLSCISFFLLSEHPKMVSIAQDLPGILVAKPA